MTGRVGKKRTAFFSLLAGSLIMSGLVFLKDAPVILIIVNFLASFCTSLAWPAINGVYADYISEAPKIEKEIEALQDSTTNLGYVIGPILAGFASEYLGHLEALSILGVVSGITAIVLSRTTPREIRVDNVGA